MNLSRAISLAAAAHDQQYDKGGTPYILHPLAVMNRLHSEEEKIVGVLHDVVEDTPITLQDLRDHGFTDSVISCIEALTRRADETYMEFIHRIEIHPNPTAKRVKIADILENMDLSRISVPTSRDRSRIGRYQKALDVLEKNDG